MPLLDTRIEGKKSSGKSIIDIVLQVLPFVVQSERETMKQRRTEGIKMAKLRGVRFGRPRLLFQQISHMSPNSIEKE